MNLENESKEHLKRRIEIPYSRVTLAAKCIFTFLLAGALSIAVFRNGKNPLLAVAGSTCIALSVWAMLKVISVLSKRQDSYFFRPRLVLTETGVLDTRICTEEIRWANIHAVHGFPASRIDGAQQETDKMLVLAVDFAI